MRGVGMFDSSSVETKICGAWNPLVAQTSYRMEDFLVDSSRYSSNDSGLCLPYNADGVLL